MKNSETEDLLAELFLSLSRGEEKIELARQMLSNDPNFEPISSFRYLDKKSKGSLSISDIRSFLYSSSIQSSESEISLIIKQYDSNLDGRLSLNEFSQFTLPAENEELKETVNSRFSIKISENTIRLLTNLLHKELEFQREQETIKCELLKEADFNLLDIFRKLDLSSNGCLSPADLLLFMRSHGKNIDQGDINSIFRRMDTDKDDLISYEEFVEGVLTGQAKLRQTVPSENFRVSAKAEEEFFSYFEKDFHKEVLIGYDRFYNSAVRSPMRNNIPLRRSCSRNMEETRYNSPSKIRLSPERTLGKLTYASPLKIIHDRNESIRKRETQSVADSFEIIDSRFSSPLRKNIIESESPLKSKMIHNSRRTFFTPLRECDILADEPGYEFEPHYSEWITKSEERSLKKFDKSNFLRDELSTNIGESLNNQIIEFENFLYENIRLERRIEQKLLDLSQEEEFNLQDAFKIFDTCDREFITSMDIEDCLEFYDFLFTEDEIYLLIRHYSKNVNGKLTYEDFVEIFSPKNSYLCRILQNRKARNTDIWKRRHVFSESTRELFLETFKIILESEKEVENNRLRINRNLEFDLKKSFLELDINEKGYLIMNDFERYLNENSIMVEEKDLEFLMERYDRNRDGKVHFSEFVQELTPKLPN